MKKNLKKVLATSVLSIGFLSSAPLAFCVPPSSKGNNTSQSKFKKTSKHYISENDLKEFFKIYETLRSMNNGVGKYLNIRVFEDRYPIHSDENVFDRVNKFKGNIITLIYYPMSFNVKRYHAILKVNDIDRDLNSTTTTLKTIKDNNGKNVTALCGKKWARVIYPFDGMNNRVEYINNYEEAPNSILRKSIVFLFNPSIFINENTGSVLEKYEKFLDDCGLKEYININSNDIKTLTIPENVKEIKEHAFSGCKSLNQITIPENVKEMKEYAFSGCKSLKRVKIFNGITKINKSTFFMCKSLEEINIPNSVKSIDKDAFWGCESLREINIPNSVTEINDYAFYMCGLLEKIVIPNSVEKIGDNAFGMCVSLKQINIPNSVKSISDGAFNGCISLEKINYNYKTYYRVDEFIRDFNKLNGHSC